MTLAAMLIAGAACVAIGFALSLLRRGRAEELPPHVQEDIQRLIRHAVEIRLAHEVEDYLRHDEGHRQAACEERARHYLMNRELPEPPSLRAMVRAEIATQLHARAKVLGL